MTFAYFPNIPNPPNDPADDVNSMQTNSQSIGQLIAVDHVGFNVPNGGQHNQIRFALNQAAPSLGAADSVMFTNIVNTFSELFFKNNRATIQLTDLTVSSVGNGGTAGGSQFVIDTPWNIRILGGTTNAISSGSAKTVIYPNAFTTIYTAQATANDPNAHYASAQQISTSVLSIRTDASVQVSWLVIGRL